MPPLILFLAFELISRIPLASDVSWVLRWARPSAATVITGIAAWLSYWQQRDAVYRYTGSSQDAALLPLGVDGLIVVAAVSLIELNRRLRTLDSIQVGQGLRLVPGTGSTVTLKGLQEECPLSEMSKRDRIVVLAQRHPDWSIRQVATKAGASYNYAHSLVSKLRGRDLVVA